METAIMNNAPENTSNAHHWDSIFASKGQDVSWWQAEDDLWLDVVMPLLHDKTTHIADIGSGTSLFLESLGHKGFTNLTAVDISHEALTALHNRASHVGVTINTITSDISQLLAPHPIDVWHDRAVFHFMNTPAAQLAYKNSLLRNTAVGSLAVISTFSENGPLQCSGLDVARWGANDLANFFAPEFVAINSGTRNHTTPWDSEQNFTWIQLKRVI
jgi:2-polyprenyl-3-methyl-5-hydroxy-6-metoxy-1,4-benzoquinol methylase